MKYKTYCFPEDKNNAVLAHDTNMSEMVAGSTEGGQIDDKSAIIGYLIEGKHIERSCRKEINDSSVKRRMHDCKKNITNEQE